jgi:hypothetical protein
MASAFKSVFKYTNDAYYVDCTQQHYIQGMNSYKTLHLGGIRTRVFCPLGECEVECLTSPGPVEICFM